MIAAFERGGEPEEGELSLSNADTNSQQADCFVAKPRTPPILQGICRLSNPARSELKLSDFDKVEKIGEGTFGKVYKAEYKQPDGTIRLYALKKLNMVLDE